jgi:hypothetical protein
MKQYLLLRNNHQSGPYFLEDLRAMSLQPMDLIWIEGTSTSWEYATAIEELKSFVREVERPVPQERTKSIPHRRVLVSFPADADKEKELKEEYAAFQFNEPDRVFLQPQPELKERQDPSAQKRPTWDRKFSLPMNGATNVAAAFLGVILGAFLLKKAVDGTTYSPIAESAAATIISNEPAVPDKNIRNALSTEIIAPAAEKPVVKAKPKDIKKQVLLKGSGYKTGLFGGISGLNLTLVNGSPHKIDKITVAVKYLKKNGEVIETEFFDITDVKPRSSKTLAVPEKNRGMKVEYKVVNVSSQQYKAALKQV